MNCLIVTSQWFETEDSNVLHISNPSMSSLYALFRANPSVTEIIVSDCKQELYMEDIQEIIKKKTLKTHIKGVYYISKGVSFQGSGSTWEEIIENSLLHENKSHEVKESSQ